MLTFGAPAVTIVKVSLFILAVAKVDEVSTESLTDLDSL